MNYMRCRRMWNYTSFNRMSLTPIMSRPHFVVGSCVHGALEDWLNAWALEPKAAETIKLVDLYNNRALASTEHSIEAYRALVGAAPNPAELVELFEALNLGKAMMINYQSFYGTPIDFKQYHLVQTEQALSVPIPNSFEPDGVTQNYLEGTLDAVIADKRDRLLVMENKTYSSRPRVDGLQMNFQFIAYQWLLTTLDIGPVLGLAYNGLWKRDGTGKNQTPKELFMREILVRTRAELVEFEVDLAHIVNEMASDPHITHHVPWNGCWDCGMINLCKAESRHEGFQSLLASRYTIRQRTQLFEDEL